MTQLIYAVRGTSLRHGANAGAPVDIRPKKGWGLFAYLNSNE